MLNGASSHENDANSGEVVGGISGLFLGVDVPVEKGKTIGEHAINRLVTSNPRSGLILRIEECVIKKGGVCENQDHPQRHPN
jgi:hypothetical protein